MKRTKKPVKSRVNFTKVIVLDKKLDKDVAGYCLAELETIWVDPRQSARMYFLTVFHELLHSMLPDLKEKQIFRLEQRFGPELWKVVKKLKKQKKI